MVLSMKIGSMKKGEIYFANLDPAIGSEIKKTRPVLIVSNDESNQHHALITVIPLTSQVARVFPFEVLLLQADSGLSKDSKAQCNQIRALAKQRFTGAKPAGKITESLMNKIHDAIKLHLGL